MAGQRDLPTGRFPAGARGGRTSTVQLFKDEVLGVGSYGKVCRAERDHLPCAAKIIHETLFDPTATAALRQRASRMNHEHHHFGPETPFERFRQECEILSNLRHPNVIQYLGTYQDPATRLPVLLMELMEVSLTRYLEDQQRDVHYHVQVNICNDIVLALTFLHNNSIIHRDLSSNNVLLSGLPGNIRAKVTDFGMARLVVGMEDDARHHSRSYSLTACPGATVYMPPEAIQDNPVYTNKIDCFSFGVLVVQVLTRQFPNPSNRHVQVQARNTDTHRQRTLVEIVPEIDRRNNHISLIDPNHSLLPIILACLRDQEFERPTAQDLCEQMDLLKRGQEYTDSVTMQNPPMVGRQHQLHLRRRRGQEQGERLDMNARQAVTLQRESPNPAVPAVHVATGTTFNLVATRPLRWNRQSSAPCEMYRWCNAVVGEDAIYFRRAGPANLHINYSYGIANQCWELLPRCPLGHPTLTIIDGQLTAIGDKTPLSNQLCTLQGRRHCQQWVTVYPPMPTRRYLTTALCTEETSLLVAGGVGEGNRLLTTVEVMRTENRQWATAASLPLPLTRCSITLLGGHVYLLGGLTVNESSRRVHSCSLGCLMESASSRPRGNRVRACDVWNNTVADLPVYDSTCVSFRGTLLAIGGRDEQYNPTAAVHRYIPETNSWEVVSHMERRRYQCFAIVVPNSCQIMVVGGAVRKYPRFACTSEVEVTV